MDFNEIMEQCKVNFRPFDKEVIYSRKPLSFIDSIEEKKSLGKNAIISEVKFASPLGKVAGFDSPLALARQMVAGGACGLSVLTEEKFFKGCLEYLEEVSSGVDVPVLRKDFIFHPDQIKEAYYYGGDSLLLISSFFATGELKSMIDESRKLHMEPLVEVHSKDDIPKAKDAGAKIYLINNRDKDTLKIDLHRTEKMAPLIDGIKISASGILTPADLKYVLRFCDAALIGTSIMKSGNIKEAVEAFVNA